jgi:hypothetical protein
MDFAITSSNSSVKEVAVQAQQQIALFFAADTADRVLDPFNGNQIWDPDGAGRIFEVPVERPLPEALNYYP